MEDPKLRLEGRVSGDEIRDTITGILVGFTNKLNERGGWLDIITKQEAEDEIIELIETKVKEVNYSYQNVLDVYWRMLLIMEGNCQLTNNPIDKITIEGAYSVLNKIGYTNLRPRWENKKGK